MATENQVILTVVQKEIEKVENAIKREKAILKNIDDITATLEHIAELVEAGTEFPASSAWIIPRLAGKRREGNQVLHYFLGNNRQVQKSTGSILVLCKK